MIVSTHSLHREFLLDELYELFVHIQLYQWLHLNFRLIRL